jgi:hypothetical protein
MRGGDHHRAPAVVETGPGGSRRREPDAPRRRDDVRPVQGIDVAPPLAHDETRPLEGGGAGEVGREGRALVGDNQRPAGPDPLIDGGAARIGQVVGQQDGSVVDVPRGSLGEVHMTAELLHEQDHAPGTDGAGRLGRERLAAPARR